MYMTWSPFVYYVTSQVYVSLDHQVLCTGIYVNICTHVHECNVRMTVHYQLFHVKLASPIIERKEILI